MTNMQRKGLCITYIISITLPHFTKTFETIIVESLWLSYILSGYPNFLPNEGIP